MLSGCYHKVLAKPLGWELMISMHQGKEIGQMTARTVDAGREHRFWPWGTVQFFAITLSLICLGYSPAAAQMLEETLLPFAVNIQRTPKQAWLGYGIYLGRNYFLTAAHVVGQGSLTKPKVVIEGKEYPTTIIKEGAFEDTDLTLLSVEEALLPMRLRLRRMQLCTAVPQPGEEVGTLVPGKVERSRVFPPQMLPEKARRFSTAIADVARTGASGSGVFDLRHRCLVGIMSRKISESRVQRLSGKIDSRDIAKYFVPSPEIAEFLSAQVLEELTHQKH